MATSKRARQKSQDQEIDLGVIEMHQVSEGMNFSSPIVINVYRQSETAKLPSYATDGSACFDLYADFTGVEKVKIYDTNNREIERVVQKFPEHDNALGVVIDSGERALIPLNLIFDIPENWKMLIYSRSGNSLKKGVTLANGVGVVDHDYVGPVFITIHNNSDIRLVIKQSDRVAQAEVVPVFKSIFIDHEQPPSQKTERSGGFGSTGTI